MAEETRVEGNVSGRVYLKYFTSGCSVLLLLLILLLSFLAEVRQPGAPLNSLSSSSGISRYFAASLQARAATAVLIEQAWPNKCGQYKSNHIDNK